jgi:N-ethylmaleimide reductase
MAKACPGEMYTDSQGMQPHSTPRAMTATDIAHAVDEYAKSAQLAIEAGFDGVELHAANGYLIEQFLNAHVNERTDAYGGSIDSRNRFALEVSRATAAAIGAHRVGIRLSPYGVFNSTGVFRDVDIQYLVLIQGLSELGLQYVHLLDHSAMGAPSVPADLKIRLRDAFQGLFILAGGFDRASAESALRAGQADLIAFARPFLANPDLVERMRADAPLNAVDMATFYTPGPKGYTDYPVLAA